MKKSQDANTLTSSVKCLFIVNHVVIAILDHIITCWPDMMQPCHPVTCCSAALLLFLSGELLLLSTVITNCAEIQWQKGQLAALKCVHSHTHTHLADVTERMSVFWASYRHCRSTGCVHITLLQVVYVSRGKSLNYLNYMWRHVYVHSFICILA